MSTGWSIPTILVAGSALRHRDIFADLKREGYVVLECHNESEALDIARIHSRPIHVMLVDGDRYGRDLGSKLIPYRPHMRILFINSTATENDRDELAPHLVVDRLRELFKPKNAEVARRAGAT